MPNLLDGIRVIDRATATKTRDQWLSLCRAKSLICAQVNGVQDIAEGPQIRTNGYVFDFDHEALGSTKTIGFPLSFSRVQPEVRAGAPELGQHTEEVLLESGHTWEYIQALRDSGVI